MELSYVVGFMFSPDLAEVALIQKRRPAWQCGKLNGIGGHVEPADKDSFGAMAREFTEETGAESPAWTHFATMREEESFLVDFFFAVGDLAALSTVTDEPVVVVPVADLQKHEVVENLPWLIPLALDCITDGRPYFTQISYPVRRSA